MFNMCKKIFWLSGFMVLITILSGNVLADISSADDVSTTYFNNRTISNSLTHDYSGYDLTYLYNTFYQGRDGNYIYNFLTWNKLKQRVQLEEYLYFNKVELVHIKNIKLCQNNNGNNLIQVAGERSLNFRKFNSCTARQTGKGNLANRYLFGFKSFLEIVQEGNYNSANQIQNSIRWWYWDGLYNGGYSHQYGFYNFINQLQFGTGNLATNYQEGNFNYVEQEQTGAFLFFGFGGFNDLIAEQCGEFNTIKQIQYGDRNFSAVYQYGYGNLCNINQRGFNNKAVIRQS